MFSVSRVAFVVLIGCGLCFTPKIYSQRYGLLLKIHQSQPEPITEGAMWVQKCIEMHPEITWLADENVKITQEGHASNDQPYSIQLYGKKFVEFDRTMMTLHCLRLILDGSDKAYEDFTAVQKENLKLSKESFEQLHKQAQAILDSNWGGLSSFQMAQAMETALVLGDIGKSEKARSVFTPYGAAAPDHDDFHGEAMAILAEHPELCPSFNRLPKSAQELLLKTANLAHYGHITHLEGDISMFATLKQSEIASSDPIALSFDYLVHTCDVAGALGHVNNRSSIVYTENSHRALQATLHAVQALANPEANEADAYNHYIKERATWLGLNPENRSDRILARIGSMLRLFTPEQGRAMQAGIEKINPSDLPQIISFFDIENNHLPTRTPTYMPAVLVNLANNPSLGETPEIRLTKAIELGLPFIARVLDHHQTLLRNGQIDPAIPLNFNPTAGTAKTNPDAFSNPFTIHQNGEVQILD